MKAPLEQDAEGKAEAQKQVPSAGDSWRRKDKYGLVWTLASLCAAVHSRVQLLLQHRLYLQLLRMWKKISVAR